MIPYDPTNKDIVLVYFGNWFANNFLDAFFKQNPGIGFKLDESTIHSPFDIATLNYILPGLYQYYGLVNKDCYAWIEFIEAGNFTIYPTEQKANVRGRLKAHIYVVGGNLDGSNQLFLTLNGDEASANFTVKQRLNTDYNPPKPEIYLESRELVPGMLTVSDSRIPNIDIGLIWRGFNMLLQKNGNLFPIVKVLIQDTINFRYPPVIKGLFSVPDLKVIYLNSDTLGFSCNPDFNVKEEELDKIFEEFIQEALAEEEEEAY